MAVIHGAFILLSASPERHREADPHGPGRQQGQHAQLQERGDNPCHAESVNVMTRETVIANSLFIAHAVSKNRNAIDH